MTIIVDSRTNMVMDVITSDEEITLRKKEENEFGAMDWDYD